MTIAREACSNVTMLNSHMLAEAAASGATAPESSDQSGSSPTNEQGGSEEPDGSVESETFTSCSDWPVTVTVNVAVSTVANDQHKPAPITAANGAGLDY